MFEYLSFVFNQLSDLASPAHIWRFYEQFGLRTIIILVNTGIIAFALPNLLDQSECKLERDSYIKSLFERKQRWMKLNSLLMLILAVIGILTYLAIWNAVSHQQVCNLPQPRSDNPERFATILAATNICSIAFAVFALNQKIFCIKHKQ